LKCPEETGQSAIVTQRKEPDDVQFLSGIFEGKTTGTQSDLLFKYQSKKSLFSYKRQLRPSQQTMFMGVRDYCGGGRSFVKPE
jgi:chorismate synthase